MHVDRCLKYDAKEPVRLSCIRLFFLKTVLHLVLSYLRSLSANVFSTQLPLDDAVWSLLQKVRRPFSRRLPAFSGEDITFLLSYFKTPSVGPASGIEPVPNILQSSALPTELTRPRLMESYKSCKSLPERVSVFFPCVIILAASLQRFVRSSQDYNARKKNWDSLRQTFTTLVAFH